MPRGSYQEIAQKKGSMARVPLLDVPGATGPQAKVRERFPPNLVRGPRTDDGASRL